MAQVLFVAQQVITCVRGDEVTCSVYIEGNSSYSDEISLSQARITCNQEPAIATGLDTPLTALAHSSLQPFSEFFTGEIVQPGMAIRNALPTCILGGKCSKHLRSCKRARGQAEVSAA